LIKRIVERGKEAGWEEERTQRVIKKRIQQWERRKRQNLRYKRDGWRKFAHHIFESRSGVCEVCRKKLERRGGGYITHCIDTDHGNRIEENFMLLCPRCHHEVAYCHAGWGSCGNWHWDKFIHHLFVVRKGICEVCGEKLEERAGNFAVYCKDGDKNNLEYSNFVICCPKCNKRLNRSREQTA
jgi:5-methylcytosine-specific restriction endonuclease McrA